uniref:Uncharacterized protein n=1 Tax=Cacopsylla melanoneura TaxID=428564 RepID=A0A8D8ZDJ7_9HEMI
MKYNRVMATNTAEIQRNSKSTAWNFSQLFLCTQFFGENPTLSYNVLFHFHLLSFHYSILMKHEALKQCAFYYFILMKHLNNVHLLFEENTSGEVCLLTFLKRMYNV